MAKKTGSIVDKKNLSNTNIKPGGGGESISMGTGSPTNSGKLSLEKSKNDAKNTWVKNSGNKGNGSVLSS